MFRRFLIRIALRLLDSSFDVDYRQIDKKAFEEWAYRSFDEKGWRSYFAYEDMKILKELSFGKEPLTYHILIGRRLQLLYLFDEMKKAVENRVANEQKKQSQATSGIDKP